jgi:hypoxanthine phosphoribosyltransferase
MKLINNYIKKLKIDTKKINIIIIIFIICLYHYYIQNGLEKQFSQFYLHYDIKRPLQNCQNKIYSSLSCIGMPSGHAEVSTIFFSLLYIYKFISLPLCILFIFIFSIQRVISSMHTIGQVVAGIILGLFYSQIYAITNMSVFSFLFVFMIGLILVILIINKINSKIEMPIPEWVDPQMLPSIKKKMETSYYVKILSLYGNAIIQEVTFVSWKDLEICLDKIIERIKASNINYDYVVGIKTGGAIISDYISRKLNIKNYKVKLTRSEYNCNKTSNNYIYDSIQRNIFKNNGVYDVCEGIDENLTGKNVILIDESICSGITMTSTLKYLRDEKKVNVIFPASISLDRQNYKEDEYINYIIPRTVCIWPWGYDN